MKGIRMFYERLLMEFVNKFHISFWTCTNGYQDTILGPGCNHWSTYNWLAYSLCPVVKILKPQPPSYYSLSNALCGFGSSSQSHISYKNQSWRHTVKLNQDGRKITRVYRRSRKSHKTIVRCQFKKYKQIKFQIVNCTLQGFVKT